MSVCDADADEGNTQRVRDPPATPTSSTRNLVHETTLFMSAQKVSVLVDLVAVWYGRALFAFKGHTLSLQVTDAISTPCVGMASDGSLMPSFLLRFGRRISWHAIGTICVSISFPFIFNSCFACSSTTSEGWRLVWFIPFIMLFQFGWAAVQISHLALIPELSGDKKCRSMMGSIRYSFTVVANLGVFGLLAVFLNTGDVTGGISSDDLAHFRNSALIVVGVGIVTSMIFYATTREPQTARRLSRLSSFSSEASGMMRMSWKNWFRHLQFYEGYVAILPIVSYTSSFVISSIISAPSVAALLNRKALYLVGCVCGLGNCVGMIFQLHSDFIYIIACLLGIAQAILLVTSLAITADLINKNTESGAFVYGTMSFLDKMANGLAYQAIQLLAPSCDTNSTSGACGVFYRNVMVFVPGGCLVLALIILVALIPQKIGKRGRVHSIQHCDEEDWFDNDVVGSDDEGPSTSDTDRLVERE
ncbi:Major facilitator superfamily domain-containing protein 12 [Toxocara canis]|uniref:Major facilitator superfamily domain-containing protein 12 n=1 Tax=Toxocara canis TaxID=6265 RepID=A0A0B2UUX5_TOXCA|nr:Major facilitator superfamily domain-containing protein 12 [Toxocara canis]